MGGSFVDEHVGAKRKAYTAKGYDAILRRYFLPALGKRKAELVTAAEIAKLHLSLRDRPYQANRLLATIDGMYFFAAQRGLIPRGTNPIVLSAPALALLQQAERRGPFVILGATPDQPRSDLKKPWRAIQRHAGLEDVRIHDLRHTFASVGAGSSLGLPIVGKLLAHSQPATTARYAHLDADPLRKAADIIGESLAGAMQS